VSQVLEDELIRKHMKTVVEVVHYLLEYYYYACFPQDFECD